ncbi:MAG: FKBP-type peptidyl-prolyl cis-trans isomerase [Muribaculaceae bacterium]|nr:hypothetical protein [Bacteroides sp.]MDE7473651.1 FKBP-type peptidyl-prolyl cis-trans isomerase [Muribaculaceae bacterium]
MKKIILSLCAAALTLGITACGDKAQNTDTSAQDKALGDSLATAYGEYLAAHANQMIDQQLAQLSDEQKQNFSRAEFLRGMKAVAERDTANIAYIMGMQIGSQVWGAAKQMPEQFKLPVSAQSILKAFDKVWNADSIGDNYMYQMNFQSVMSRAQEYAQEKENMLLESAPEAVENKAKGAAYADSLVATGNWNRAESGLVYQITNPGEGETVKNNDRIKLRYKGMHIDGTEFDATRDEAMTTYPGRFIPGFTEGIKLLGKGGKATIVLPADIAYGVRGSAPKIGPNETLVFEIEVEDIL